MLNDLLTNIELSSTKEGKRNLVQKFLRKNPSEDELFELVNSDAVKYSVDLQYVLKRHFTDMEYKKINNEESGKYDWLHLLAWLHFL